MADENGVEPDAKTITVTDIFFAGGLRVQAKGDVISQVKQCAKKEQWARLEDVNGNETQVRAVDALAIVKSEGQLVKQEQKLPGTPGGQKFNPKVMKGGA